jgi:cytochrome oxidase Cu insertion factor (SCO1/SenC/PrrC family)
MSVTDPEAQKARKKNRTTMIALAILFFGSLGVAGIFILHPELVPVGGKANGELINPPRALPAFELSTLDGETLTLEDLKGAWTIAYVGGAKCPQACADNLAKIKQARLLQGGELKRIKRLYLMTAATPAASLKKVLADNTGLIVAHGEASAMAPLLAKFKLADRAPVGKANRVYIIDPRGYLMMSYPAKFDTGDLVRDIKRLLKVSWVG